MAKDITTLKLAKLEPWNVPTGHKPHRSGAGKHDGRPNRQRTRQTVIQRAVRDY